MGRHREHQTNRGLRSGLSARATGLAVGVALDAVLGDPRRHHPVAWFGTWASRVEKVLYADSRQAGARYLMATVGPWLLTALTLERTSRRTWWAHAAVTAATTWAALGAHSLVTEGRTMARHLESGDLPAAREQLPHLCGRDPRDLGPDELARATVESLAENTNDGVVCTLWWGAVAGIPGIVTHRAVNTLDAMVGHRSPRYARFGSASAVTDDVLAWIPARLTALFACVSAPVVHGSPARSARVVLADGSHHPSPNGGWCEAAWAGALGVTLGGRNVYAGRVEERGLLGTGPRPGATAVRRAARLVAAVTGLGTLIVTAALLTSARARLHE